MNSEKVVVSTMKDIARDVLFRYHKFLQKDTPEEEMLKKALLEQYYETKRGNKAVSMEVFDKLFWSKHGLHSKIKDVFRNRRAAAIEDAQKTVKGELQNGMS